MIGQNEGKNTQMQNGEEDKAMREGDKAMGKTLAHESQACPSVGNDPVFLLPGIAWTLTEHSGLSFRTLFRGVNSPLGPH